MNLHCSLPTADGVGLSANTIAKANKAVERVLTSQSFGEMTEKRKYTTAFMPKDHAFIGRRKQECNGS